jgi:hypothetical protein
MGLRTVEASGVRASVRWALYQLGQPTCLARLTGTGWRDMISPEHSHFLSDPVTLGDLLAEQGLR